MLNAGHTCTGADKSCREGMDRRRHDPQLPWDHPEQHNSHAGGCICRLGKTPYQDVGLLSQIGNLIEKRAGITSEISDMWDGLGPDRVEEMDAALEGMGSEIPISMSIDELAEMEMAWAEEVRCIAARHLDDWLGWVGWQQKEK